MIIRILLKSHLLDTYCYWKYKYHKFQFINSCSSMPLYCWKLSIFKELMTVTTWEWMIVNYCEIKWLKQKENSITNYWASKCVTEGLSEMGSRSPNLWPDYEIWSPEEGSKKEGGDKIFNVSTKIFCCSFPKQIKESYARLLT